jgi:multidrug transporter EmrE-like cation transporter
MGYVYIALTIACTVYGQLIMKQQMNAAYDALKGFSTVGFYVHFLMRPLVISGFVSAGFAALFWIAALSKFQLSYAYPFMSLSFVLVVALSILLFGESVNVFKLFGVAAICGGLVLLGLGAR